MGILDKFRKKQNTSAENTSAEYNFNPEELDRRYKEEMEDLKKEMERAEVRQKQDEQFFNDIEARLKQFDHAPGYVRANEVARNEARKLLEEIEERKKQEEQKRQEELEKRKKKYLESDFGQDEIKLFKEIRHNTQVIDKILNNQKEIYLDLPDLSGTFKLTRDDLQLPFLLAKKAVEIIDDREDKEFAAALKRCNNSYDNLKYVLAYIINAEKTFFPSLDKERKKEENSLVSTGVSAETPASVSTDKTQEKQSFSYDSESKEIFTSADYSIYPPETSHRKK